MQKAARHQQYMAFKAIAEAIGYGLIRQVDIRTRATFDTDGNQEQATAGASWSLEFFKEADSVNALALRTKEPIITGGKAIPDEYMLGFRAVTLEVPQQTTTFTGTELMEIMHKLSLAVLQMKSGPQIVLERRCGYLLSGYGGVTAREDATNAAAGTANVLIRDKLSKMQEGDDIDDPIVVLPGGSFSAEIYGEGPWTTTDDVPCELSLHGWVAHEGEPADKAKLATLSELYALIEQGQRGALRARAGIKD
jgi:hypothetical protein